ncbi:MAG TPA: glycosyltransferase family 39 protein, partial [Candidatus Eisenbacteria bacterium]
MARALPGPRVRWIGVLVALGVLAFAWRLAYLARLARTPLAGSLTEDAQIYWDWSGFLLRHGPVGRNVFFMGPLYPYLLTLLRLLTGDVMARVLAVQAAWGAVAAMLLADAARRLTRPAIGAAIGLLAALYPMAVFFDGLVLMESLLFAVESLLLWRVVRGRLDGWPAAAAIGALIGLLAEGRATSALLLLPAALLLLDPATRAPAAGGGAR